MIKIKNAMLATTASAALMAFAGTAMAQSQPQTPPVDPTGQEQEATVDEIIVVGSQIRGASTTAALPVVVLGQDEIQASGASSGDDLMRSIPQMGDVLFEAANNPQTSNSARGDVNSVNLRSLGVGNT
ncbi:MAG: hypothetical protein QE494_15100, partial [Ramlibacter sp.]|uniref:hypothetical protein n=1 Tax=Ramlibacter sp. TaxID=1917967 RepID=UPI002635419F